MGGGVMVGKPYENHAYSDYPSGQRWGPAYDSSFLRRRNGPGFYQGNSYSDLIEDPFNNGGESYSSLVEDLFGKKASMARNRKMDGLKRESSQQPRGIFVGDGGTTSDTVSRVEPSLNQTRSPDVDSSMAHPKSLPPRVATRKPIRPAEFGRRSAVGGPSKPSIISIPVTGSKNVDDDKKVKSAVIPEEGSQTSRNVMDAERAAVLIQSFLRGYLIRRTQPLKHLRIIARVKSALRELRAQRCDASFMEFAQVDTKARIRFTEAIMDLLLQLDAIQGAHPVVREFRKSATRDVIQLQEEVDSLLSSKSPVLDLPHTSSEFRTNDSVVDKLSDSGSDSVAVRATEECSDNAADYLGAIGVGAAEASEICVPIEGNVNIAIRHSIAEEGLEMESEPEQASLGNKDVQGSTVVEESLEHLHQVVTSVDEVPKSMACDDFGIESSGNMQSRESRPDQISIANRDLRNLPIAGTVVRYQDGVVGIEDEILPSIPVVGEASDKLHEGEGDKLLIFKDKARKVDETPDCARESRVNNVPGEVPMGSESGVPKGNSTQSSGEDCNSLPSAISDETGHQGSHNPAFDETSSSRSVYFPLPSPPSSDDRSSLASGTSDENEDGSDQQGCDEVSSSSATSLPSPIVEVEQNDTVKLSTSGPDKSDRADPGKIIPVIGSEPTEDANTVRQDSTHAFVLDHSLCSEGDCVRGRNLDCKDTGQLPPASDGSRTEQALPATLSRVESEPLQSPGRLSDYAEFRSSAACVEHRVSDAKLRNDTHHLTYDGELDAKLRNDTHHLTYDGEIGSEGATGLALGQADDADLALGQAEGATGLALGKADDAGLALGQADDAGNRAMLLKLDEENQALKSLLAEIVKSNQDQAIMIDSVNRRLDRLEAEMLHRKNKKPEKKLGRKLKKSNRRR